MGDPLKDTIVIPLHINDFNILLSLLDKVPSNNKEEARLLINMDNHIRNTFTSAMKFIAQYAPEPKQTEENGSSKPGDSV